MRHRILLSATLAAFVSMPGAVFAQWGDNFDSYATGSSLHGQGGWKGWANDPGATGFASDAFAISLPNSAEIIATSDLVHEYSGYTSGQWVYSASVFVPEGYSGSSYFILLNTYNDDGVGLNWSVQVEFSSTLGVVDSEPEGAQLPLITGQWVELRCEIDLDADSVSIFYDGQLLSTKSWTDGVSGNGALNIGAVDLFGNGASAVYYDDMLLGTPPGGCCLGDLDGDGFVTFADLVLFLDCLASGGFEPECACADMDDLGDGVTFQDLVLFLDQLTTGECIPTGPAPGACCVPIPGTPSFECQDQVTPTDCLLAGGAFLGEGSVCSPDSCNGACCTEETVGVCFPVNQCQESSSEECAAISGSFQGPGTTCDSDDACPLDPIGACCVPDEGGLCTACLEISCLECETLGGSFVPDFTCDLEPCVLQCGRCCENDVCTDGVSILDCAGGFVVNKDCESVPCPGPECNAAAGDCCVANGSPGCNAPVCCAAVCAADPFCCDVEWDAICADEALLEPLCPCGALAQACCFNDGTCQDLTVPACEAAGNGGTPLGPGTDCISTPCPQACCFPDGSCQDLEAGDCQAQGGANQGAGTNCAAGDCQGLNCPLGADGDCCVANGTPGCENVACCDCVCAFDAFCCDTSWDGICAGEAAAPPCDVVCACGGGGSDCCIANGTPGCDDPTCEACVCALDPFCCDTSWDDICAGEAANECAASCPC